MSVRLPVRSAHPIPEQARLPVLTRADWEPAEKWFRDTPRYCAECSGRKPIPLFVEPPTFDGDGRVYCLLCGREFATVSLASTLFVVPHTRRWARDHDACTVCGETTSEHSSSGRCMRCHGKHWRSARRGGAS